MTLFLPSSSNHRLIRQKEKNNKLNKVRGPSVKQRWWSSPVQQSLRHGKHPNSISSPTKWHPKSKLWPCWFIDATTGLPWLVMSRNPVGPCPFHSWQNGSSSIPAVCDVESSHWVFVPWKGACLEKGSKSQPKIQCGLKFKWINYVFTKATKGQPNNS